MRFDPVPGLFLLASPGAEGFTAFRPLRAGVREMRAESAAGNRLNREMTLYCPPDAGVSPGDALFPLDSSSFSSPLWLITQVRPYPRHVELKAEAFEPVYPQDSSGGFV